MKLKEQSLTVAYSHLSVVLDMSATCGTRCVLGLQTAKLAWWVDWTIQDPNLTYGQLQRKVAT